MKLRWIGSDLAHWAENGRKTVMVLAGARQVGKTTLARELGFSGFEYVSLDDPMLRADLARVSAGQFARRFPKAILDEVQKVPDLIEVVKAIVDRGGPERYLLLGSSHILLLDNVRESLVGRVQLRHLWPLAFTETLFDVEEIGGRGAPVPALLAVLAQGRKRLDDIPATLSLHPLASVLENNRRHWLEVGGMPVLWEPDLDVRAIREELSTYVTLYLERDLADLVRLRDLDPFVRLQRLAAERTGTVLKHAELARDAGLSTATANNYLRYLELSFQIVSLPPFFANRSKRLIKSPRLHWTDIGIWRAVTRRWEGLSGELYESAVITECLKILQSFGLVEWEAFHLRTYDQREIDLLLVQGDRVVPIEIKSKERIHRHDARHLRAVEEVTGLKCDLALVIYRGREVVELEEGVWAVPDALLFAPLPADSSVEPFI